MVDSTGTTSYDHYADAVYNEYPPGGRTVWYDYSFGDYGLRTADCCRQTCLFQLDPSHVSLSCRPTLVPLQMRRSIPTRPYTP